MGLTDYSTNPANNGVSAGQPYWPEGMLPAQVNDTGRQMMADLANWLTAPTFTGPYSGTFTATVFRASANNTGQNFAVGDDAWIGDRNITSGLSITGQNDGTSGYIQFGNVGTNLGVTSGGPLSWGPNVIYHAGNFTSTVVTNALGYTPYNSSNPANYISSITGPMVTNALGYTPANAGGQRFSGDVGRSGSAAGNGFVLGLYGSNPMYELGGTDTGIYLDLAAGRIKVRVLGQDVMSIGTDGIRTTGNVAGSQGGV